MFKARAIFSKAVFSLPSTVWVLGLASLLTDTSTEMIHAVLPMFLVTTLGASITSVGLIEGIAEATASVLKIFSGALSDYLGQRKWLVVSGYGLSAIVKPLFVIAQSPMSVLAARVGDRIGKGIRGAPRDALVADCTSPENRGAAFGFRQSLDTIGAVVGPLIATVLLYFTLVDLRFIFALALIPAFAAVLLLTVGIKEPRREDVNKVSNGNGKADGHRFQSPLQLSALKSLGDKYWALVLVAFIFNLGNFSDAFILLKAQDVGIAKAIVPVVLVVMNVAYALSAYPAGILSDKFGRFGLLVISFILNACVYAGLAVSHEPWQIWTLLVFYGLYLGLSQGNILALVSDLVPTNLRGTAMGAINLVTGIALLPASLLAGWLWHNVSSTAAFFAGSIFALFALILLVIFNPRRERRQLGNQ